jgi:CHAT domain-containing protein
VRNALPENARLIEFTMYHPSDPRVAIEHDVPAEPHYVAYVISKQGDVQWKELGPAREIDGAVTAFRQALRDPERRDTSQLARALDEKLMRPLRPLLNGATQLLISPDGELNVVPFVALVDEQGQYLIQRYSITYLTSGRDLLRLQAGHPSQSGPVVVADPSFGEPALLTNRDASPRRSGGVKTADPAQIDYSQVFFGPLPGVSEELRALRALLPNASFLTHEQATKAALQGVNAPSVLHIATHGFFLAEPGDIAQATPRGATRGIHADAKIENPLLRSGLALAGANRKDESGILTALEASGLNLWGTKLVVLSACDTGVGEIRNGEGVYGLRRALVLAGAETQMTSLWPVSDRSTHDLMISYYKSLLQGNGRGDSLREAQLQMLQSKSHNHPYYWASFIQTGEWANLDGKR